MAFVENILVPLITFIIFTAVYTSIFGGVIYGLYLLFFIPKKRVWFSYKVFKKKPKDKDVAWCISAAERNITEMELRKHCLLQGFSRIRTEEICYIFSEVIRELKGGLKNNGERHKKNHGETEFPKV